MRILASIALLAAWCATLAQPRYDVTVVCRNNDKNLPRMTEAVRLNNHALVGGGILVAENQYRAGVWEEGRIRLFQPYDRYGGSSKVRDQFAGGALRTANGRTSLARWDIRSGELLEEISMPLGLIGLEINGLGWIAGTTQPRWQRGDAVPRTEYRYFLYRDGVMTPIPRRFYLQRQEDGGVRGVSNDGLVVGMDGGPETGYICWYWTERTSTQRMFPEDIRFSWVNDLNNLGQAVGIHSRGAFLWQNGAWRGLGLREPMAINDRSEVLGYDSDNRWLVLLPSGERRVLNDLFDRSGGYVRLDRARDINDRGQVLALLQHADGHYAWVILTPRG